jgi:DnaJ-class molecular chaperone
MSKKGNFSLKGEAGDLLIKVNVRPHPYFRREGSDIYTDKFITFTQAVLGGSTKVETLTGKVDVKIQPGTTEGQQIVL